MSSELPDWLRDISDKDYDVDVTEPSLKELNPNYGAVGQILVNGGSMKDAADELDTNIRAIGLMERELVRRDIIERSDDRWHIAREALEEEDNESFSDPGVEYDNSLQGRIVRSIERAKRKEHKSIYFSGLNVGADKIRSAAYDLAEAGILSVREKEDEIFVSLDEEFRRNWIYDENPLKEEHLGVFHDTITGYSPSEIEERRDIREVVEYRHDISPFMPRKQSESPSVEYELSEAGERLALFITGYAEQESSEEPEAQDDDLGWTDIAG